MLTDPQEDRLGRCQGSDTSSEAYVGNCIFSALQVDMGIDGI